jgi:hypothetical protein
MGEDYKVETKIAIRTAEGVRESKKLSDAIKEIDKQVKKAKTEAKKAAKSYEKLLKEEEKAAKEAERAAHEAQRAAASAVSSIGGGLTGLGRKLSGTSIGVGRVVTGLLAMGATYVGVRSVTNAIRDFVMYSGKANSSVETLTLSLGTVMSEIEGMSFERSRREAHSLYRQIQDIAITSPGTAAQVADVFTMAYGPMRRAGAAMDDILRLSQNTLSVASALRIDLPQVSRDISMMATGVAGTDVKTFRLLRSMGLITKSTREWNEMAIRDPTQAARELMRIFESLGGPAAEAFGNTWQGVTSAFGDIFENFSRILGGSTFAVVRDNLRGINQWLLRYRSNIENVMEYLGESIGRTLQTSITRIRTVFEDIGQNMDQIVRKIDDYIARFKEFLPAIKTAAKLFVGITVATKVIGPILMGLGGLMSAFSGLSSFAGVLGIGGGAAAAGTAGAAGAAGTAGAGAVGVAGLGGLTAAASAAGAALAYIVPIIIAIGEGIVVGGAIIYATFKRMGSRIWAALQPAFSDLREAGVAFWDLIVALWGYIEPQLVAVGSIIAALLIPIITGVAGALRGLGSTAKIWTAALRVATNMIVPRLHAFSIRVVNAGRAIADFVGILFRAIAEIATTFGMHVPSLSIEGMTIASDVESPEGLGAITSIWEQMQNAFQRARESIRSSIPGQGRPPGARPQTNIDMRGSHIEIRQDFRDQDPDRVAIQVMEDLGREAVRRTQTPFISALTR